MNVVIEHALQLAHDVVEQYRAISFDVRALVALIDRIPADGRVIYNTNTRTKYDDLIQGVVRLNTEIMRVKQSRKMVTRLAQRTPNQSESEDIAMGVAVAECTLAAAQGAVAFAELDAKFAERADLRSILEMVLSIIGALCQPGLLSE